MDKDLKKTDHSATVVLPKGSSHPKSWQGAFAAYKPSREAVMLNIVPIVELWLINIVASVVLRYIPTIGQLISALISVFIGLCIYQLYLSGVKGNALTLSEVIDKAKTLYLQAILLYILLALSCLSFLLLIIPGLIIVPRIVLSPYFLIDKKLSAVDAYKASWNATRGHVGKVYGIFGVSLLMIIPSITIIGILLTIYWLVLYGAASAILYQYIIKHKA